MMNQDLVELLKIEALEISNGFQKASIEGKTTPQEVADRREIVVSSFLQKYFPFPYRIVKGNVIDSFGRRSDSIDCLILNPSHPYTIDPLNKQASVIFADGVDYAIEVKPDLSSKSEIYRALKQIRSIKQLVRKRTGVLKSQGLNDYSYRIPGIVFSNNTYDNTRTLIEHIVEYYENERVPAIEQFDLIAINNNSIIINLREGSLFSSPNARGIAFKEYGENTLMMFLLYLNSMPHSEMEIGQNIMSIYIEDVVIGEWKAFLDLNERLENSVIKP